MKDDITPKLYEEVESEFKRIIVKSKKFKDNIEKLKNGKATFKEANEVASIIGDALADSFKSKISENILPDGKMYFNIAERLIGGLLKQNYDIVGDYSRDVQTNLNKATGSGLKGIKPPMDKNKVKGIVDRVSTADSFSKIAWILDEPIKNFTQSIVDDTIKANADKHYKLGMQPKIVRKEVGDCCDWCKEVEGEYRYPNVPENIYKRHRYCRCTVEYDPGDGKRQNVHTKKWQDVNESEKVLARIDNTRFDKININSNQFGKKASKHMEEYGLDIKSASDRKIFKNIILEISENPEYTVRGINWRGFKEPVIAYVKNGDAVLVTKNNEFITIMRGGASNARIKNKRKR